MNEDKKKFRGEAIVCFIDILGFSDDIKKNWDKPESDDHPLNKILAIKKSAKEFEKSLNNLEGISAEEYITINSISDSFVIRCRVDTADSCVKAERIYAVIASSFCIWAACIMNGYTVRGAISIGDVYWDDYSTIGNAFIDVYNLESSIAKNSRIIISSDMNKKLAKLFHTPKDKLNPDFSTSLTEIAKSLRKDVDGYLIINPKTIGFSHNQEPSLQKSLREPFIKKLSEMKDKVEKKIVKEKYTPLINMLKSENSAPLTASDFGHY